MEGPTEGPGRDIVGPTGEPHGGLERLRVSDEERHAVAEVLREAAGEGRITLDELDGRLEATYAARTYADLVPLTADLPGAGATNLPSLRPRAGVPAARGPAYQNSWAVMAETKRNGLWEVGPSHTAFALMGSVVLDLRQAHFAAREVEITANTVMGSVEVILDAHIQAVLDGTPLMGEFGESRGIPYEPHPEAPVVRLRGVAFMGSVTVKRKGPPGAVKRRRLPR